MTGVALTYFPKLRDAQGTCVRTTWAKLLERLSVPKVAAVKNDLPGLSLATYRDDRRALANVERVYAVGLDLDEGVTWSDVRARFAACASFVHSTWSSTLLEPRARVFLLLSRPVTGDEYRIVYAAVAGVAETGGLIVDRAASDPSRFWFLPAAKPGAPFTSYVGNGPPVNVDAAIASAPTPPPPPSVPSRPPSSSGGASAIDRARAYLARCPGAVSGSGGHNATFVIASKLVRGFLLSPDEAYALLANDWNPRCDPPWSERELRRKVDQAAKSGRMPEGDMLARERAR